MTNPLEGLSVVVDAGLVSISHWGAFDIAPFGALIREANKVEWQENGEPLETIHCSTYDFENFVRRVER